MKTGNNYRAKPVEAAQTSNARRTSMDSLDNNRLLLEIDRTIRNLNRETINPEIPELTLRDLEPVLAMVARARAKYLKELLDLSSVVENGLPSHEQIHKLSQLRHSFEELINGAKALETAIERGYLDVTR
ncbi:MAG: hypothetical protein ACWA5X_12440 [bacterium]